MCVHCYTICEPEPAYTAHGRVMCAQSENYAMHPLLCNVCNNNIIGNWQIGIFFFSSNIYQAVYRVAAANAAALAIAIRLCMGERCFGPQVNAILLGPIIYIGHFSL